MLFNFARKTKPLGLAASQKVKAIALSWPAYPDGAHKQMWVYRYTSLAIANADTPDTLTTGTRIAQTVENATVDSANLVIGADQFYRALSEDIYGNRSALSDVLTITYTGVDTADVLENAITSVEIAPDAVRPSNKFPQDHTNLIRDPEMLELGNFSFVNALTVVQTGNDGWLGPSRFYISMNRTGSNSDTYIWTTKDVPVEEGVSYNFSAVLGCPSSSLGYAVVEWYKVDAAGNPTTLISTSTTIVSGSPGVVYASASFIAPGTAQVARIGVKFVSIHADATFGAASFGFRRMVSTTDYVDGSVSNNKLANDSVTTVKVADHAISDYLVANSAGSIACGAATNVTVQTQAFTVPASTSMVMLTGRFRNTSGGTRTLTVSIKDDLGATIDSMASWDVRDNEYAEINTYQFEPTAGARTYTMIVNMSVAGMVSNRKLHVAPIYR